MHLNECPPSRTPAGAVSESQEPLLKWAGGKRRLLGNILPIISGNEGRYFEPFLGGGAVFFALAPKSAVLSDVNPELINCYRQIKIRPLDVIKALGLLKNNEKAYYEVRRTSPGDKLARAARIIYLTSLSFNGIYRQNLDGVFNVPYGRKTWRTVCDSEKILSVSEALRRAKLRCCDFEESTEEAAEGDVVYFDPPYTVAHSNNGFVKYNAKIFSWSDQKRLSEVARKLARRGCIVVVSNADHPSILDLYKSFQMLRVERLSVVAASGSHRKAITECLFHS